MATTMANSKQSGQSPGYRPALPVPARSALWTVVGAATMYLLDPDRGRARRARLHDQAAGALRHLSHHIARTGRYTGATVCGVTRSMFHHRPAEREAPNDPDLVQRVETELFRDPHIPKGAINISAENGTIVLRGQLDCQRTIRAIERAVRKVHGVHTVRNLMHLPGTPAPNKAAALTAQRLGFIPALRRIGHTDAVRQTVVSVREDNSGDNPDAPGEPNRARQRIAIPVPGTGRKRKAAHMRAHDAEGEVGTFEKIPHHEHEMIQHP